MMTKLEALAADWWIENTERIYKEKLHMSGPIMDAYKAGFEEAKQQAMSALWESGSDPTGHGDYLISQIGKQDACS